MLHPSRASKECPALEAGQRFRAPQVDGTEAHAGKEATEEDEDKDKAAEKGKYAKFYSEFGKRHQAGHHRGRAQPQPPGQATALPHQPVRRPAGAPPVPKPYAPGSYITKPCRACLLACLHPRRKLENSLTHIGISQLQTSTMDAMPVCSSLCSRAFLPCFLHAHPRPE